MGRPDLRGIKILREMLPKTKAARSGDFGEMLATEVAEQTLGFTVPLRRLRWKDGRNMALRGDDIVGIRVDSKGKLIGLLKGESKSYAKLTAAVIEKAGEALDRERGRPSRHGALFSATRLRETGDDRDSALAAQLEEAAVVGFSGTAVEHLSAQIERDLSESLMPLGFSVSSLYGAAGIEKGDEETLRDGRVVVSTPEKLDFALRNDPTLIDDVGLIVLDEGHMLGPNEREVRYEALVQRLVRRSDAAQRRIVCLSALFPTPKEMIDLVAWLRADEPGEPIHSRWRPTRQRFGTLRWGSVAARLDVKLEEESPFVERFVEQRKPPKGLGRRKAFPADKKELTLEAAWRFVEQEKDVLVYCVLRRSVETLGLVVLRCIRHGVLTPLEKPTQGVRDAMAVGAEWLGAEHPAVACLEHGVALHHGGLPRPFLNEVERLLRAGDCRLTIASPTLAQGLNLSASVLLVPTIVRSKEVIPAAEFANVAGRAGRAFVDVEGLVLHVVWEDSVGRTKRLNSKIVKERSSESGWPTERSRPAWLEFSEGERKAARGKWKRETQTVRVVWSSGQAPSTGTPVIVEPSVGISGGVFTPDLQLLGLMVRGALRQEPRNIVGARVAADGSVEIFDELLERIRNIRASERRFYQKVLDIYATSVDYQADVELSQRFFATVQNKMHWAAHGHTAAEIVHERADGDKPFMGMQTTRPGGVVRKADAAIAKSYLTEPERRSSTAS
jgi:hypothetical protein